MATKQQKFFNALAHDKGFHPTKDCYHWYTITLKDVTCYKGGTSISRENGYINSIVATYPNLHLDPDKWISRNSQGSQLRAFFDGIASQHNFSPINEFTRWYTFPDKLFLTVEGASEIRRRYGSFKKAIANTYFPHNSEAVLAKWEKDTGEASKIRHFFDDLAHSLGFHATTNVNRWYSVTFLDVISRKGGHFISKKFGGYKQAILATYPDIGLDRGKLFDENGQAKLQRIFFDSFAHSQGFHPLLDLERWYDTNYSDIVTAGGYEFTKENKGHQRAIISTYPNLNLDLGEFAYKTKWYLRHPSQQVAFFDDLASSEGFDPKAAPHMWSYITRADILARKGGSAILELYGTRSKALKAVYPTVATVTANKQGESERALRKVIENLFGTQHKTVYNSRKVSSLSKQVAGSNSGKVSYYELDIWIPRLNIAFEYQDKHHYAFSWYAFDTLERYKAKDRAKLEAMRQLDRTLIVVPCWWDQTTESLIATIRLQRPDLLKEYEKEQYSPIPDNPPLELIDGLGIGPVLRIGIGGLPMLASFVWPSHSVDNWWIGEKYDGMRAIWNSFVRDLFSKNGFVIDVTAWFKKHFPATFLDGELWMGRSQFKNIVVLFKAAYQKKRFSWAFLRYVAFDAPTPFSIQTDTPFERRYGGVLQYVRTPNPVVLLCTRVLRMDSLHTRNYLEDIVRKGGEGIMIRKPLSVYELGRSHSIFKQKVGRDGEAVVLGKKDGVFKCKLPNQVVFKATKKGIIGPIRIGSVVTYKCTTYSTSGIPKQAVLIRIRDDLTWDEVVLSYQLDKLRERFLRDVR